MISINDLPEKWGLLFYKDKEIHMVKESDCFERDKNQEIRIMYSLIRRLAGNQRFLNFRKVFSSKGKNNNEQALL